VKTLDQLDVRRLDGLYGPEIQFHVRARSFLHNQVRSFVGTLERVGAGAWSPDDVREALQACNRAACGPVSPPHGLYLAGVGYADDPFQQSARRDAQLTSGPHSKDHVPKTKGAGCCRRLLDH
jgi:tRNA pseudouridine38-40 synthase